MSHPDLLAPPDTRPIELGEVWENPVTLERAVIVDLPWLNDEGRLVVDLTALPGARVVGEHLHPALDESFSVQEGELTMLRDGRKSVLRAGEGAKIEPGVWHYWWNEGDVDAIVRGEITPGERFAPHDRDAVRARPRRAREQARDAAPAAAGAVRDRVLRRVRLPQATGCCSARSVRHRSRRSPAAAATARPTRAVENDARTRARPATLAQTERLGWEDRQRRTSAA